MEGPSVKPVYLITGRPGMGKTSIIKQVIAGSHVRAGGFYTEEIRAGGTRLGFRLVTLGGREAVLAHVDISKRFRVGKYGVDTTALEKVGIPALLEAAGRDSLVVVDEIGKMELLSLAFREAVTTIIDGNKRMLGTIMLRPDPRVDGIKRRPNIKLATLTRENFHSILADVQDWLKAITNLAA
jgi:nucleoside-triphosphatase